MAAKPTFNGRMHVDVGETMHRRIYNAAKKADQTMSAYVRKVLKETLARKD